MKLLFGDARPAFMLLAAGSGTGRVSEPLASAPKGGVVGVAALPVNVAARCRQVVPPGSILPSGVRMKAAWKATMAATVLASHTPVATSKSV